MAKKKQKPKRPSLVKFLLVSTVWLALILAGSGRYWGIWGTVGELHSTVILHSLLPSQKEDLAKALNFHYSNTILRRCTKGLVLSCDPNVKSIRKQFNWFYRNTLSAQFNDLPDYHTLVSDTMQHLNGGAVIPIKDPSTFDIEFSLVTYTQKYGNSEYTQKDKNADFMTQLGFCLKYGFGIATPEVALAVSAIGLVHDILPDLEKLVPAIQCFQHIRLVNWLYSSAILWLIFLMFLMFYTKRTFFKEKSKNG